MRLRPVLFATLFAVLPALLSAAPLIDFVEPSDSSVLLTPTGGPAVTDDLSPLSVRHVFPVLSFVAAGGITAAESDVPGFSGGIWLVGANGGASESAGIAGRFSAALLFQASAGRFCRLSANWDGVN